MAGNLPERRIDRAALERIIQRAAELQAHDVETGEGMTEKELLRLGAEVGIDGRYLRQALYESSSEAGPEERGLLASWAGPGTVAAARVVPGDRAAVEQALEHWMTESEALAVKRRMPDRTVWEPQKGFFADMKRGFGVGGRSYELAKAHDVTVAVTPLEEGYCHVALSADVSKARAGYVTGGTLVAGAGGALALLFAALSGPAPWLWLIPFAGGVGGGWGIPRLHRGGAARVQLALEQVLDRLERSEIKPRHRIEGRSAVARIAEEVGQTIADLRSLTRQPPRRVPPSS